MLLICKTVKGLKELSKHRLAACMTIVGVRILVFLFLHVDDFVLTTAPLTYCSFIHPVTDVPYTHDRHASCQSMF
jgi:hypothetical protein